VAIKSNQLPAWSRRRFLQVGACSALGVGLTDVLRARAGGALQRPRAAGVILVWLDGGPATIDMWDPKPEAGESIRGEFRTISTSLPGVAFSEHMARSARMLDRCVLVRSLHHNIPDHVPGAQYVVTGNKPSASLEHPSVGSLAAHLLTGSRGMPPYFTMGATPNAGAGFLGPAFNPFPVQVEGPQATVNLDGVMLPEGFTTESLTARRELLSAFDRSFRRDHTAVDIEATLSRFQLDAYDILTSNRIAKAFDLAGEAEAVQENYGRSEVGRHALTARRLIEAGARFVTVGVPGWDTHTSNFAALRGLLPPVDQAVAALVADLDQRGMLDETLVVCGGEFGRTPVVNGAAGRDHWSRAMSVLLAGGGLRRGYVHGATDEQGFDPVDDACTPDDLAATVLALLGFPHDHEVHTTSGRPVKLMEFGVPIRAIMA
jgi:hypothetical protein